MKIKKYLRNQKLVLRIFILVLFVKTYFTPHQFEFTVVVLEGCMLTSSNWIALQEVVMWWHLKEIITCTYCVSYRVCHTGDLFMLILSHCVSGLTDTSGIVRCVWDLLSKERICLQSCYSRVDSFVNSYTLANVSWDDEICMWLQNSFGLWIFCWKLLLRIYDARSTTTSADSTYHPTLYEIRLRVPHMRYGFSVFHFCAQHEKARSSFLYNTYSMLDHNNFIG